jgi:hypothetical protein
MMMKMIVMTMLTMIVGGDENRGMIVMRMTVFDISNNNLHL